MSSAGLISMESPRFLRALGAALVSGLALLPSLTAAVPSTPSPLDGATNTVAAPILAWAGAPVGLTNGGFEDGFAAWIEEPPTLQTGSLTVVTNFIPTQLASPAIRPLDRTRMAALRCLASGSGSLQRELTIPNTGRPVRLIVGEWLRAGTFTGQPRFEGTCELALWSFPNIAGAQHRLRHLRPEVRNTPVRTGWVRHGIDVTEFAGQTVRLVVTARSITGPVEVLLDDVRLETGEDPAAEFEVRLGTRPDLGAADLLARTREFAVSTPPLRPGSTQYWQVLRRSGEQVESGPVWSFQVGPVGPARVLDWEGLDQPLAAGWPAPAALQMRDDLGHSISTANGPVSVVGLKPSGESPRVVISEVAFGSVPSGAGALVEVANVTASPVSLAGWRLTVWDQARWPQPVGTAVFPANASLQGGRVASVRGGGISAGSFPNLNLATPLYWTARETNQLAAVLLQDSTGAVMDFVALGGADPAVIGSPLSVPAWHWIGAALPTFNVLSGPTTTWQRVGSRDHHSAVDWTVLPATANAPDRRLVRPMDPSWVGVDLLPGQVSLVNGRWSGALTLPGAAILELTAFDRSGVWGSRVVSVSTNPAVVVELPARIREDAGSVTGAGVIRLATAAATDVTVTLSSLLPEVLTVAPSVTVPAGATEARFDLTLLDDLLRNGTRDVRVMPSVAGFTGVPGTLRVDDNETAVLGLQLPTQVREGDLSPVGFVTVTPVPDQAVQVRVVATAPQSAPQEWVVRVPAGAAEAPFRWTVPDDQRIDGPRMVTVTASVENWTAAQATTELTDDERAVVSVSVGGRLVESDAVLAGAGQITLGGTLPTNVVVQLTSTYPQRLQVPAAIEVPAGQRSVAFDVTLVDNDLTDGNVAVTVTAAASGFEGGTVVLSTTDNDAARFTIAPIASPQAATWEIPVEVRPLGENGELVPAFRGPLLLTLKGLDPAPPVRVLRVDYSGSGLVTARIAIDAVGAGFRLVADDGRGHTGESAPFELVEPPYRDVAGTVLDAAWDAASQRFYLASPAGDPGAGALSVFDPVSRRETGRIEVTPPVGTLAVSGGGEFLYAVTVDGGEIQQFRLPSLERVRRWNVVREDLSPGAVEDLAVQPGQPEVLAVTRYRPNAVPHADGVVIYDQGLARSNTVGFFQQGVNRIEWGPAPGELLGFLNESTAMALIRMQVDADGVTVRDYREGVTALQPGLDIGVYGSQVVVSDGTIVDPGVGAVRQLPFENAVMALALEPDRQRVYGAVGYGTDTLVRAFDFVEGRRVREVVLPGLYTQFGGVSRLLRWGNDGLAALVSGRFAFWNTDLVPSSGVVDLALTAEFLESPVAGQLATVRLRLRNRSALPASGVTVSFTPDAAAIRDLTLSRGGLNLELALRGSEVLAELGTLGANEEWILEARFVPTRGGPLTFVVRTQANAPEEVRDNNRVALDTHVGIALARRGSALLGLAVQALAAEPGLPRLLATRSGTSQLIEINATNGAIVRTLDIAETVHPWDRLVVAADGSRAYAASSTTNRITEVDLVQWSVTRTWSSELSDSVANVGVRQLATQPGSPATVAALLTSLDPAAPTTGVQFYDAGDARWEAPRGVRLNAIAFSGDGQTLYGTDSQPSLEVRRFQVTAEGLQDAAWNDRWIDSGSGLTVAGGRVYVGDRIFSDDASLARLGRMPDIRLGEGGVVAAEAGLGFRLVGGLEIFDLHRMTYLAYVPAPAESDQGALVRWGSDGLAWFDSQHIGLMRTDWLPEREAFADLEVRLETSGVPEVPGGPVRVTARIRNLGPAEATGVRLNWNLPPQSDTEESVGGGFTEIPLGTLAAGGEVTRVVEMLPTPFNSPIPVGAWIRGAQRDLNPTNQADAVFLNTLTVASTPLLLNLPSAANQAVWDPIRRLFYVTLSPMAGRLGDTVVSWDPVSGVVSRPVRLGSQPNRLALAGDSSRIYVALDGTSEMVECALPDWTPVRRFPLGVLAVDPRLRVVRDSFVVPGRPDQVVASLTLSGQPSTGAGIATYRAGVKASQELVLAAVMTVEPDVDASRFWATDGFLSGASLYRPELGETGITTPGAPTAVSPTALGEFVHAGPWLVGTGGGVFSAATGLAAGTLSFPNVAGSPLPVWVCAEPDGRRVYSIAAETAFYVEAHDPATLTQVGRLDTGTGTDLALGSFQRWGVDGLAYMAPGGLRVFRSPLVIPNPTSDWDADGMPDAWEQTFGTDPHRGDANLDLDGDGQDNASEYAAGTAPNEFGSRLELRLKVAETGGWQAEVEARSGRRYQLEGAPDAAGPWTSIGAVIEGTGSVILLPLPTDADSQLFRVRVGL